jgi:hypothetical protein
LRDRSLRFFPVRFTATSSSTEWDIKIDVKLGPVFERKCGGNDFRIVSTVLGVPINTFHKGAIYDAKVIVDRKGLNRLPANAFPVRTIAWP